MNLSQGIVVVNEYTIGDGKGNGSRGGTPGDYVLRYMSRKGATEPHGAALVHDQDTYITKYMTRKDAAESISDKADVKIRDAGRLGGMAFSEKTLSLSDEQLRVCSKDIQKAFDDGHTVLKTVLSFDTDYLIENKVLPEGFTAKERGDFKGQVDQMRLRSAIVHGLSKISPDYDDLRYVGVIQVDTLHVHCHLAMCDFGRGILTADGTQKGKLSQRQMQQIKRGVDLALDESREVQHASHFARLESRNVQTFLKNHTYNQILLYGAPQKLLTHLPEDETLWRASSNRKEMKKANKLCRDYVEYVFKTEPGRLREAERHLKEYADIRGHREGLSDEQKKALFDRGREDMVKGCMNSVYQMLRSVPKERRRTSTPFLDLTSQPVFFPDYQGGLQDFVYRAGAYSSRLHRHKRECARMASFAGDYEKAKEAGNVSDGSDALYQFFLFEQRYHDMLAEKYSRFLFFMPPTDEFADEFLKLQKESERVENFRRFLKDPSAKKMLPVNAEQYGRDTYGIYGGRFLCSDPDMLYGRFEKLQDSFEKHREAFDMRLSKAGLSVSVDENGNGVFSPGYRYSFAEVRALDLHELRGDFSGGFSFDAKAAEDFIKTASERFDKYEAACEYLIMSGQPDMLRFLPGDDIYQMHDVSERILSGKPIPPAIIYAEPVSVHKTVMLDKQMHDYLAGRICSAAEELSRQASFEAMDIV